MSSPSELCDAFTIDERLAMYAETQRIKQAEATERRLEKERIEQQQKQKRADDLRVAKERSRQRQARVAALNPSKIVFDAAKELVENDEAQQKRLIDHISFQGSCLTVHSYHWNTSVDILKIRDLFPDEKIYEEDVSMDLSYWFPLKKKITKGPFEGWTLRMEKGLFHFLYPSYDIFLIK